MSVTSTATTLTSGGHHTTGPRAHVAHTTHSHARAPRRRTSSTSTGGGLQRTHSHTSVHHVRHGGALGFQPMTQAVSSSHTSQAPTMNRKHSSQDQVPQVVGGESDVNEHGLQRSGSETRKRKTSLGVSGKAHGDDSKARLFRTARSDTHLPRLGALSTVRPNLATGQAGANRESAKNNDGVRKARKEEEGWSTGDEEDVRSNDDEEDEEALVMKLGKTKKGGITGKINSNAPPDSDPNDDPEKYKQEALRMRRSVSDGMVVQAEDSQFKQAESEILKEANRVEKGRSRSRSRGPFHNTRERDHSRDRHRHVEKSKERGTAAAVGKRDVTIALEEKQRPGLTHRASTQSTQHGFSVEPDQMINGPIMDDAVPVNEVRQPPPLTSEPLSPRRESDDSAREIPERTTSPSPGTDLKIAKHSPSPALHHETRLEKAQHFPFPSANRSDDFEVGDKSISPGSDANTLIASTPRLQQQPSPSPTPNVAAGNNNVNPGLSKHIRTRNSHSSLRSLASMHARPPHPLSSPSSVRTRLTSLQAQRQAVAQPQLNRETAQAFWSNPTSSDLGATEFGARRDSTATLNQSHLSTAMSKSGSSRSLLDGFNLPGGPNAASGNLRKASFTSTTGSVKGLPPTSDSSGRLSAYSAAQAAARLPAIAGNGVNGSSTMDMSSYPSETVALVSRFIAPPANKRGQKGEGGVSKTGVFPESPFAASHASLVKTLREEGATVSHSGHHRGDTSGRLGYDGRSKDTGKGGGEIIWGLSPFEMSMKRCLEMRKGGIRLATGKPLGPIS